MRTPRSGGEFAEIGHIQRVRNRAPLLLLLAAAIGVPMTGLASAAAGPTRPADATANDRDPRGDRDSREPRDDRGNGGGRNPIVTPPRVPTPPRPVTPVTPVAPRNPIVPPSTGGGSAAAPVNRPGSGGGGTGGGSGGGTATRPGAPGTATPAPAAVVPRALPTAGLSAGSTGAAQVDYFVDLDDVGSAAAHLTMAPAVLAGMAAQPLGRITLRPLAMGRAANSTEAACALVAASRQNRAWQMAQALAALRSTTDGDWLTPVRLRTVARSIGGLSATAFIRATAPRSCYAALKGARAQAIAANVGSSPTYVARGPGGVRSVSAPGSADAVIAAIAAVS